jgi:ethanolamine utilization cobalamin adenosyltransferase
MAERTHEMKTKQFHGQAQNNVPTETKKIKPNIFAHLSTNKMSSKNYSQKCIRHPTIFDRISKKPILTNLSIHG